VPGNWKDQTDEKAIEMRNMGREDALAGKAPWSWKDEDYLDGYREGRLEKE
jgi:hypothetical protein